MKYKRFDLSVIRREAREMLRQGETRQNTYDALAEKSRHPAATARIIKQQPSKAAMEKYGFWNYILFSLLLVSTVLYAFTGSSPSLIIYYIILMYPVFRMMVEYYWWLVYFMAAGLLSVLAILISGDQTTIVLLAFIVLNVPAILLSVMIRRKMCPRPVETREKYITKTGEEHERIIYAFRDI
jgi:hypothetical protein